MPNLATNKNDIRNAGYKMKLPFILFFWRSVIWSEGLRLIYDCTKQNIIFFLTFSLSRRYGRRWREKERARSVGNIRR